MPERQVDLVLVVAETQERLNAMSQLLKNHADATGRPLEVMAVHGLRGAQAQLDHYINLVVLDYFGSSANAAIPVLGGIRKEYRGPLLVVNDDGRVDSCTWGRRHGADYHAGTLEQVPEYIQRVLARDRTKGKTAIVLAGGGILGGFNEAGSLKALYDYGIRDFDMYLGLSAGAFVAALAANGITPELMIEHPDLGWRDFYHLNKSDLLRQTLMVGPNILRGIAQQFVLADSDWLFQLSSILTTSPLRVDRIRARFKEIIGREGGTNDFAELRESGRELFIMAVDLDTTQRRVFGEGDDVHVPISDAVAASAALPMFYRPVRIDGRDYVDGGLARSACLDTAIEHGADLIVCVNPLVPYTGGDAGHIKGLGLAGIAEQSVRTVIRSRLHATIERYKQIHPHVTIILIEPDADDPALFHNPLRSSEDMIRLAALEGFKSTKAMLERETDFMEHVFAAHGRPLDRTAAFVAGAGPYVPRPADETTEWDRRSGAQSAGP